MTVERRLYGYLLSGYPFIRAVEKWQFNTKVTLHAEEDIEKQKKRLSEHIVITKML